MKILTLLSLVALGAALAQSPPAATIKLVDVAAQAGLTLLNVHGAPAKDYIIDANGNGAAFLDYDNDDDLDVLIVNGSTRENILRGGDPMVALYQNDGKGRFTDVTVRSGLTARGWGMGVCVADYDNDGFRDVYVTGFGPNVLYHNNGEGAFRNVTAAAGVNDTRWSMNCAFGDYDHDGDVDLYVANYVSFDEKTTPKAGILPSCSFQGLNVFCGPTGMTGEADVLFRNDGNGRFTDVTERAGIKDPGLYGFGAIFSDLDGDGWADIFVANDSVPNLLFRNKRDGTFAEEALVRGVALSGDGRSQAGMGVDAGDYDGDGDLDLIVTNFESDYNTLYENDGRGSFIDVTHLAGLGIAALPYLGWGVAFVDIDNDGLLDIFVANGHVYPTVDGQRRGTAYLQRKQLFKNLGTKRFRDVTSEVDGGLLLERSSRGAAFGDFDNDGDVDVLVINLNDRPTFLRNDTTSANHWITVRLMGAKSNRDGIGARVQLSAGGRNQIAEVRSGGSYLSDSDIRAHFGLANAALIDRIEIRWPSGLVETLKGLQADRFYVAREGQGVRQLVGNSR